MSTQQESPPIYIDSSVDIVNNKNNNKPEQSEDNNNNNANINKHANLIALVDDYMVDTAEISQNTNNTNNKPLGVDLDFNVLRRQQHQHHSATVTDDDDDDLSTAYPPSGTEDELSAPHFITRPKQTLRDSGILSIDTSVHHYAGDDERPDDDDDLSTDLSSVGIMAVHHHHPSSTTTNTTSGIAPTKVQPCASTDPTMDDDEDTSEDDDDHNHPTTPSVPKVSSAKDENNNSSTTAPVESPSSRVRALRRLLERDTSAVPPPVVDMGYGPEDNNSPNSTTAPRPRHRRRASASMISRISTFENAATPNHDHHHHHDATPTAASTSAPATPQKKDASPSDANPRRSLRRSNSFGSLMNGSGGSTLSNNATSELGLLEGFYRAQQLQKHHDRQKYKEQWDKYHVDYKEDVLASEIMNDPSAKATQHSPGTTPGPAPAPLEASRSESFHGSSPSAAGESAEIQQADENAQNAAMPTTSAASLVDYKNKDYKGFVFVVHDTHGLLLLHCTRKKKKPPHYQLPGGHIDEPEFLEAARAGGDAPTQLLRACQAGAARELYEETGMDVRQALNRLEPAQLKQSSHDGSALNEFKGRLFFFLQVSDKDFFQENKQSNLVAPQSGQHGVLLKLSHEHSGFTFEAEPSRAANLLKHHSGGKCSEALLLAMNRGAPAPENKTENEPVLGTAQQTSTGDENVQTNITEVKQVDRQLFSQNITQMELDIDDPAIDVFPEQPRKGAFHFFAECFGGFKDCKF